MIPIPLTAGRADAALDIKAVLEQVYDAAGYGYHIYTDPHDVPPLSAEDSAWATSLIPARP